MAPEFSGHPGWALSAVQPRCREPAGLAPRTSGRPTFARGVVASRVMPQLKTQANDMGARVTGYV